MANRWSIPDLGFGLGLRAVHYQQILTEKPAVDWFEILAENYLDSGGLPLYVLDKVAERYPIVMHGVSMSVGGTDPIDFDYLGKLKKLAARVKARWVSDHLCWTGVAGTNTLTLLPIPYTDESLAHVANRVHMISEFLERPVFLENPSTYIEFSDSHWRECDFLAELTLRSGCGLLLDVNNVYINAFNHGFNAEEYIDRIPVDRVVQVQLAGHRHLGTHILDTRDDHVEDGVWELYRRVFQRMGSISTLLEWDNEVPSVDVVHAEALKANAYRQEGSLGGRNGNASQAA